MAIHSSILNWEIPWTEEPGWLQSMGSQKSQTGQEYWSGLPCRPSGNLPNPGIEPASPAVPVLQADSLPLSHLGSPGNYPVSELPRISQNYTELCYLLNTIFIWAFILLLPKMWVLPTGDFHEGISWFRQRSIKYTCASLTLTSRDESVCTSLPLCMKHPLELLY